MSRHFALFRQPISVRKALTLLVVACLVPSVLIGLGLVHFLYQEDRAHLQRGLLLTTRALALAVDRDLDSAMARAATLAVSPSLQTDDLTGFYQQAQATPLGSLGINIVVSRPDGQQVINTIRPFGEKLPIHGSLDQLRRTIALGQPNVSDLFIGGVLKAPLLAVEAPVRSNGQIRYVLSIGIYPSQVAQLIRDQKLPPKWLTAIFDSSGTIVARSHDAERFVGQKATPALLAKLPQQDEGIIETKTVEGFPSVIAFSHAPNTKWAVAVAVPIASLESGIYRTVGWVMAIAAGLLAAALVLATFVARHIAGAVTALSAPAAALGRDQVIPQQTLPLREANAVMKAMEEASILLARRTAERDQAREDLEARVVERTQQLRDALNRAETATQAKSDFLSNMSHEIRTPLNAITGLTALMLDSAPTVAQREYLGKIKTSTSTLLGILNDILDYSKIEAGRLDLENTDFDIETVLRDSADLFSSLIAAKGTELFLEIDPNVPPRMIGDPLRLSQILNNLIGNAVKFTPRGEIHVRVSVIETNAEQVALRFTVRDTGIGMNTDQIALLFQPFAQADASISRRFGGSGLGLTIAHRLATLMGGGITVESHPTQGSIFTVIARFQIAASPVRRFLGELREMRVLVVDDQETSLMIMRAMLEAWGGEVTTVNDGAAAVEAIQAAQDSGRPFELVIIDWRMPIMDGIAVARAVQRDIAMHRIQPPGAIMLMTAHDRELLKAEMHGSANPVVVDDILTKPITHSILYDAISRRQQWTTVTGTTSDAPHRVSQAIRGAHILLVEDNDINQMVARELLLRAGLLVTTANNGQEAVDWARRAQFDAILMDLQMPVMDGLEAARQIRRIPACRHMPIIAMTAAALPEDRAAAIEAGMNDHLTKPISPDSLGTMLIKWIKAPPSNTPSIPAAATAAIRSPDTPDGNTPDGNAAAQAAPVLDVPVFPTLTGIDTRQLALRLGDNPALFETLIRRMAAEFANIVAEVRKDLDAERAEEAAFKLHTLRGVAANVAAVQAARLAGQAETAIKDEKWGAVEPLLNQLDDCLTPLVADIAAYIASHEAASGES